MKSTLSYLTKVDRKMVSVVDLSHSDEDDLIYWLSKPPIERLLALEMLRQQYYRYDSATARLSRVLDIIEPA